MSKAVGIDLGTTNSAVAIMDPTDTDIVIHRDAVTKSATTPSCVWRNPGSGELVVGRKALIRQGNPPEPVRSIKRRMGQRTTVSLAGVEMSPEQVSAAILGEMKRQIEQDVAAMGTADASWLVDRAIVTVPAYFDQPQIDATRRAAQLAGLEVLDLLHEPTAAACYHCWRTQTRDGTFLVYDLGGGTFDVSIVRCTSGVYKVLGISGNNRLGGDDVDDAIARRLQERLLDEGWALDLDLASDPEDRLRFNQLKILAEGAKKALSEPDKHEYVLRDTTRLRDKKSNPVLIETVLERAELEDAARPLIAKTLTYCHEALERAAKSAGVSLADIDEVLLAGGSTHMPLVREMVAAELCAGAKCDEPVYEKVDTVVALGAAIRASVVGGLDVYDQDRSIRMSFRGAAATGARSTHVGGTATALADDVQLGGGYVRMTAPDGTVDESDISPTGSFAFTGVPVEAGVEVELRFEVFDGDGELRAELGRPLVHSDEAARRLPGPSNVAVASKAVILEVSRGGKAYRRELVPALQELPTSATFSFSHPGDTETVLFPLYQQSKKIQIIRVPVPRSTPRGTPIQFNLQMDRHSFITVEGSIGDQEFEALVELPPDRDMPSDGEVVELRQQFDEAALYLNPGELNVAKIKQTMALDAFEEAKRRGDKDQAVHEFEQAQEIIAALRHLASPLDPPKHEFDDLVARCLELNSHLGALDSEIAATYDAREMAKSIEAQRAAGERAYQAANQVAYGEAFRMVSGYRDYLNDMTRKTRPPASSTSNAERAAQSLRAARQMADSVRQLAGAVGRPDIRERVDEVLARLDRLSEQAESSPVRVASAAGELHFQLEQFKGVLNAAPAPNPGRLVVDHDHERGQR